MKYSEWGKEVIAGEIAAMERLHESLGKDFDAAAQLIKNCRGKVIVSGLGKSGHIGKKMAATFASLGIPSFFVHSGEALHGDSGMIEKRDVIIAISNSGGTAEVAAVAELAKKLDMKVIAITAKPDSPLGKAADVVLNISVGKEVDHLGLAPTSSSTVTLALGDALAVAVSRAKGFTAADFSFFHAGGTLGKTSRKKAAKKKI